MPRINAKGMAEMIALPGYAQVPILAAQKNPKQGPAQFKRPYYAPAIDAIRAAYRAADSSDSVGEALAKIESIPTASRRDNLRRALASFAESEQLTRKLTVQRRPRIEAVLGSVELRASPDIVATDELGRTKLLYYHCKSISYDSEAAKRLVEIAHWLCEQNELEILPRDVEFIDLSNATIHRVKSVRAATIKQMKQTAKVIEALWDDI